MSGKRERLRRRFLAFSARFDPLATYNAERSRGIVHTPQWQAKMAALQAEFDAWISERP